jgi:hypothetical protein
MRAIHSHRAHSATSQGVYLSGRRTPGGTSRARRLLATNTALLTSAHRMISPPSHKRKPCTLPTHPPLHNPTKPKTAASKQKGTHTTRSLALPPNTPNTKPSLALLSSSPALGRFSLSRPSAPDATRRGALRPFPRPHASLAAANRSTTTATDEEATSQGRLTIQPPRATLSTTTPANAAAALDTNMPHAAPHAHTHTPASSLSPIGRRRRRRAEEEEGTASTHLHTRKTHTPLPSHPDTVRRRHREGRRRHRRRRPWASSQASARNQPRAEQPSQDAATSRAAEPRRSSDVLLLPVPRSTHTPRKHTHARSSPAPLAAHTRTRRQARRRTRWQGAGKARTHAPRAHARASRLSDLHAQSSVPLRPARAPRSRTCAHAHRAHAHTRRRGTVSSRRGRCLAGAGGAALPAAWKRSARQRRPAARRTAARSLRFCRSRTDHVSRRRTCGAARPDCRSATALQRPARACFEALCIDRPPSSCARPVAWLRRVVVGGRSGLSAARATLPLLVGQRCSAAAHGMAGAVWPVRARLRQKRPSRAPALNVRGPAQGRVLVWCGAARIVCRADCRWPGSWRVILG